jgi:hypothetical protein
MGPPTALLIVMFGAEHCKREDATTEEQLETTSVVTVL